MLKQYVLGKAIVGILLMMVVGAGGCQFEREEKPADNEGLPNPMSSPVSGEVGETENWAQYTNETYGYSFKYPEEWYVYRDTIDNEKDRSGIQSQVHYVWISNVADPFVNMADPELVSISVRSDAKDESQSVVEWLKNHRTHTYAAIDSAQFVVNAAVSSRDAVIIQVCDPAWEYQAYVDGGEYVYRISFTGRRHREFWSDIVNTFKLGNGTVGGMIIISEPIVYNEVYCLWRDDDPRLYEYFQ